MFHGAVERANCFENSCYVGTTSYQRTDALPVGVSTTGINNLMNNDHQLINGGGAHMNAWNLAGTKKPNDPTLSTRAFPGFIVFPQMWNGWSDTEITHSIRIVMLLLKKYNINPNRVYIHGLSNGGRGVIRALAQAEWLFAAAAPMSPISDYKKIMLNDSVINIPTWFFQGGKDTGPYPADTESNLANFRETGATPRYSLYPELGHGTWNKAYSEPDFFTWLLSKNKTDIYAKYGNPHICSTTGAGATLMLSPSFHAYQWEKDGQVIAGATSSTYIATTEGIYRARFSRVQSPGANDWDPWSKPFSVTTGGAPPKPTMTQNGSVMLRDLNDKNIANLQTLAGYNFYQWSRNGTVSTNSMFKNKSNAIFDSTRTNGTYTVQVSTYYTCPSPKSDPKYVYFNNLPTDPTPIIPIPTNFTATVQNNTNVTLTWTDVSNQERNYEIWRRKSSDNPTSGWTMIALTNEDAVIYNDNNLQAGTEYWYKIRAVANTNGGDPGTTPCGSNGTGRCGSAARSHYAPGNDRSLPAQNLIVTTGGSSTAASPPQNLTADLTDTSLPGQLATVHLSWTAPTTGTIQGYRVNYGGNSYLTNSTATTYDATNVPINSNVNFTVNTINLSNNVSAPSNQVSVNTFIDSLFWNHSTKMYADLTIIPASDWNNKEFTGRSLNLDLAARTQDENFLLRFYGYLYIVNSGNYSFRVNSNDGSQLFIDGNSVLQYNSVTADGLCITTPSSSTVALNAGIHTIDLHFWQNQGDMCLAWEWRGPDAGPDQGAWYPIPDEKLRSFDSGNTPPPAPDAPTTLVVTGSAMTSIDMTWVYVGLPLPEFEIHRATSASGPFSIVNRVATTSFTDTGLTPMTQYWYRVRSVNDNGTSAFSNDATGTTTGDTQVPTTPSGLSVLATSFSTATLSWTQSTDNVQVIGYEIYNGSALAGTTSNSTFVVSGLAPNTPYTFKVRAYDASNNFSDYSLPANGTTTNADVYYSNASTNLYEVFAWRKNSDGTGDTLASFSRNGLRLIIANRTTTQISGSINLDGASSKLVVPTGVTLAINGTFNGQVEVEGTATVVLGNSTTPVFTTISPTSTIQYNVATNIQATTYGNLVIGGTTAKVFAAGTTTVIGNITVTSGASFRGTGNSSIVNLSGDLLYQGTPVVDDLGIALNLVKNGTQTITAPGPISLFKLSTAANTNAAISVSNVRLGTTNGGGLSLATGTTLNLGPNTLTLAGAGTINSGSETGKISVNNGTLDLASSSASNSNLYFDPAIRVLTSLKVNFSSTGALNVNSPVNITDGLKVTRGDVNSNGNLTLLSTASKTANIEEILNNGRILGSVTVQRYFNAKPRVYRYISSPVAGTKVADWQAFFKITGDFDGADTGTGLGTGASMFYYANEAYIAYPLRSNGQTNQSPIQRGVGYAAFIRNTDVFTLINTGNPHQGTIPFTITPPAVSTSSNGWQLLGNPYASTIAWSTDQSKWPQSGIASTIAVRENMSSTTNQYHYWDASTNTGDAGIADGKIAPGQAFWVRATSPTATLSINESAKVTPQQTFYRESESNAFTKIKLNLKQGDIADAAFVVFTDFGTDNYDAQYDGVKNLNTGMFNFATVTSDNIQKVAINNVSNEFCSKSIRLSLANLTVGTYSISLEDVESLVGIGEVEIIDKITGTTSNLRTQSYSFDVTSDPATSGSDRFELHVNRPNLMNDVSATTAVACGQAGSIQLSNTQKGVTYTLVNDKNESVASQQTSLGDNLIFALQSEKLENGLNSVRIRAGFKGCDFVTYESIIPVEYSPLPEVVAQDVHACKGETAVLTAASNTSGVTFNWYTANNTPLKGAHGSTFSTQETDEETFYSVAAVLPNGCEGARTNITIYPSQVEQPEILAASDTLFTSVSATTYTWTRNGEVIQVSPYNYFVATEPGSYDVTVQNGGCSKTSRTYLVTGAEGEPDLKYNVYPNPTSSDQIFLQVIASSNEDVNVKVVDLVGKEVFVDVFNTEQLKESVQLSPSTRLRAGVYVILLEQKQRIQKIKLILKE
jgi:chitodextrinase